MILHITENMSIDLNGKGTSVFNNVIALTKLDVNKIICAKWTSNEYNYEKLSNIEIIKDESFFKFKKKKIITIFTNFSSIFTNIFLPTFLTKKVKRLIDNKTIVMNNKTIFVGHHLWGGISAYILARKYNKKSVWMLYCTLGAYGLLWDLFETIIINKIAHNFDKIMILDDGSNIISKLKQKIKTKKLIVFPQAVNPVFVTQPKNNTKHNSFCIIHTAGLNKAKNPELVIEAANLLRNQDFKFHIYGEGKQKKILERNIIKMQLQNIVYIHNRKTINDIIKIMDNANIMLITSRNNSCFGRVAIESLARKLPIIATNSGRTNKLLPNNKLAIICEPTPKSLAKSIIYAKNNPQILKTITKNGFKAIKTKYNYSIRGNIIKNAFLNLIGENYD